MSRSTALWTLAARTVAVLAVLTFLAALVAVSVNNAQLRAENQAMFAAYQSAVADANALRDQLIDAGEDPVVTPPANADMHSGISAPAPSPGPQGPRGLPGSAGRSVTAAEIAEAVAEYCATGACVGPTGATGAPGADGDSVVGPQGPQGPPGESIVGPQGAAGPAGPACPEGYSVSYVWLSIAESQFGVFSRQPAAICRPA
jgi:hypothetical protein